MGLGIVNVVLRADGRFEHLPEEPTMAEIQKLLGTRSLDGFSLRDGRYVYIDDIGHGKGLPRNEAATLLYHSICKPGTTHFIVGDAVIVGDGGSM